MQNCYQYLLTVAQTIISQCAGQNTIDKYFSLKSKLLGKLAVQTQNSHLAFSTLSKQNTKYDILKTSIVDQNSKKKSRCQSRPSTSKSKTKENGQLSRARMQSYNSKITQNSNSSRQQEYNALLHMATVIKNAQFCPSMLKTITFSPNNFNIKVNSIIISIASSLTTIYNQLQNQQKSSSLQQRQQMLINDNKWLINKLQTMVEENSTLRRMAGHRVY